MLFWICFVRLKNLNTCAKERKLTKWQFYKNGPSKNGRTVILSWI